MLCDKGVQIGTVLGQIVAGALSQVREFHYHVMGPIEYVSYWPYVHYLFGGLCLLLAVLWLFTVHDEPNVHPHCSAAEREYLCLALSNETDRTHTEKSTQVRYSFCSSLSLARRSAVVPLYYEGNLLS